MNLYEDLFAIAGRSVPKVFPSSPNYHRHFWQQKSQMVKWSPTISFTFSPVQNSFKQDDDDACGYQVKYIMVIYIYISKYIQRDDDDVLSVRISSEIYIGDLYPNRSKYIQRDDDDVLSIDIE